jgi:hypothetical protein
MVDVGHHCIFIIFLCVKTLCVIKYCGGKKDKTKVASCIERKKKNL